MKPRNNLSLAASACLIAFWASTCQAQVWGGRAMPAPGFGQPMNQPGATTGTSVAGAASGSLIQQPQQGMDRFLRTNRTGRDFVGRSRSDIKSFIGAQQALAAGQVRPATDGLRINVGTAKKINQALPAQPAKGRYYPKLEIAEVEPLNPEADSNGASQLSSSIDERLLERVKRAGGDKLQLQRSGNTVTVAGSVSSQHSAELVLQLLQFEPGVDQVVNRMK